MIYLDDKLITPTIFPDKTSQIWKLDYKPLSKATIRWEFEHEGELIQVAQLKTLLSYMDVNCVDLFIPYLPYGRQDKEIRNENTFALRVFAKHINLMEFQKVITIDPHSAIAASHILNLKPLSVALEVGMAIKSSESELLCYPDKGARDRYTKEYNYPSVYGDKVRDQLSGNITHYELHGDVKNKNVLIVDDICDGGMTFILLAKELLKAGANEVSLFVTHGIFSKGTEVLRDAGIKKIFTYKGEIK